MPVNITDQSQFTDPIQAPDDTDPGNGVTFQLAPQGLANRTRHLKNRVDGHDSDIASVQFIANSAQANANSRLLPRAARYQITNGTASPCVLSRQFASGDLTLGDGDTSIEVDEPGVYLVSVDSTVRSTSTSAGIRVWIDVKLGGGGQFTASGVRATTSATESVGVSAAQPVSITDPETEKITLELGSNAAGDISIPSGENARLSVMRITQQPGTWA